MTGSTAGTAGASEIRIILAWGAVVVVVGGGREVVVVVDVVTVPTVVVVVDEVTASVEGGATLVDVVVVEAAVWAPAGVIHWIDIDPTTDSTRTHALRTMPVPTRDAAVFIAVRTAVADLISMRAAHCHRLAQSHNRIAGV